MGKRAFLVLASCGLDDIPIRLCDTYEEASTYAQGHPQCWDKGALKAMGRRDIGIGDEVPHYISIVTFNDGIPVENEVIHDWT